MLLLLMLGVLSGPEVTKYVLDNGLRVVFVEDHSAPVFAGVVQFDVGSYLEHPGITGVSHLLEHMLFKGSKKLGTIDYGREKKIIQRIWDIYEKLPYADSLERSKLREELKKLKEEEKKLVVSEEIWKIYYRVGGANMNASTGNTSTQYFLLLPSNKKEVWAKIESDRFQNLVLREFYSERDVVNEERRMGDGNPSSVLWDNLIATAYIAAPVRWPVIGWESDIMNITPQEVMDYYKKNYVPERCVIVLAGDVYPEKDIKLVKKYFGRWKKRKPPLIRITQEPEQRGTRRAHVEFRATPRMGIAFHGPYYGTKDYFALELLSMILTDGNSSIMRQELVDKGIATSVNSYVMDFDKKVVSLMTIFVNPAPGKNFKEVEDSVFSILESIKKEGISQRSLKRAKNNYKKDILSWQKNVLWMAIGAASNERVMGDPEYSFKVLKTIEEIKIEDVMNVLKKYISLDRATIVTLGGEK